MRSFTFVKVATILLNLLLCVAGVVLLSLGVWVSVDGFWFLRVFGFFSSRASVNVGFFCSSLGTTLLLLGTLSLTRGPDRSLSPTWGPDGSLSPTRGPDRSLSLSPTRGPDGSLSPTRGPDGSLSPSRGPDGSLSPTRGPDGSLSPTRGPDGSLSPTRGPDRSLSPTRGPDRSLSLSPTRGPDGSLSPTRGPDGSLSPSRGPDRSLSLSPTRGPDRSLSLSPTRGPDGSLSPTRGPDRSLSLLFFSIVLVIFIAQAAVAVVVLSYSSFAERILSSWATPALQDFGSDPIVTEIWNKTMKEFSCCGFTDYRDFVGSKFTETQGHFPKSCCTAYGPQGRSAPYGPRGPCGAEEAELSAIQGCFKQILKSLTEQANIVGGIAVGIGAVEIAAMALSLQLFCRLETMNS